MVEWFTSYSGPVLLCKTGLINIFLFYFKHHMSMRITACFLIGLLEKLGITGNNEIPKSPQSFCRERLIYYQVFTGNLRCIIWVSRFATGFVWLPLCLKSSLSLKKKVFLFYRLQTGQRGHTIYPNPQFQGRNRAEIWQLFLDCSSQTTHLK